MPILEMHHYQPYVYHSSYATEVNKLGFKDKVIPNKFEVPYQDFKSFLID